MNHNPQLPLAHWGLFRCQLRWAYDRLIADKEARTRHYVSYPTAAWLIRSGSITLRFESGTEQFGPGTWVFPKEAQGIQELSCGLHILSLRFQAEWSHGAPIFDRSQTVSLDEAEVPELTRCAEDLVAFTQNSFSGGASYLQLKGTFDHYLSFQPVLIKWIAAYRATLLAGGVAPNTLEGLDDKVRVALQLIETLSLTAPFREAELAAIVGCSVSHLNKLFIKQVGSSPTFLWSHRKAGAAKVKLLHSSDSMKAIAYHLGFSAPEHFTRWFKKQSGYSPTEFRRRYQSSGLLSL